MLMCMYRQRMQLGWTQRPRDTYAVLYTKDKTVVETDDGIPGNQGR